ncbi:MAG: glycosyltransferase family 39 protein [Kiritimatiellae bacterium]|nr:glycosyltransferase family 39 protein [Kiritimatiellia bacterium]MDD5521904.1 glycosyltransferase family 39 protein [Kiritimatiellia bacterium]
MSLDTNTTDNMSVIETVVWGVGGLIVRAGYVVWVVGRYGKEQFSDFLYLHQLAESVASGKGFTIEGVRIFNQSVGYPAFLGLFYKLFGSDIWTALVVNIVLGGISVALVYILSMKLFTYMGQRRSKFAARVTALLAALYPDSLLYCAFVSAENLFIPLLLGMLLVVSALWRRTLIQGTVVGLLAGMMVTTKAHGVVLCLFLPWIWWIQRKDVFRITLAATLAGTLFLVPVTCQNYRDSGGKFIPLSSVSGEVLLAGTNPTANGGPTAAYHLPEEVEKGCHPVDLDRMRARQAMQYMRERPSWFMGLTMRKALLSLSPARDFMFEWNGQGRLFTSWISRWLPTAFNFLLLVGVFLGLVVARRNREAMGVEVAVVATATLLQLIFCAYSRYRFPFLFCLIPLVSWGWLDLVRRRFVWLNRKPTDSDGGPT